MALTGVLRNALQGPHTEPIFLAYPLFPNELRLLVGWDYFAENDQWLSERRRTMSQAKQVRLAGSALLRLRHVVAFLHPDEEEEHVTKVGTQEPPGLGGRIQQPY